MHKNFAILGFIAALSGCSWSMPRGLGQDFVGDARRIVFLGDSNTYGGLYVAWFEAAVRLNLPERPIEVFNLGLPSETVSGLSEPGHAGGEFPRPDLAERLSRVLDRLQPDLVIACYGMNCGIYHPYSDARFEAFRNGVRRLRSEVENHGARLVMLTPPVFDSLPIEGGTPPAGQPEDDLPDRNYDDVLSLYAAWLVAAQAEGWETIDVHGPMRRFLAERRKREPNFSLALDGVHLDCQGHWLLARELIRRMGSSLIDADAETAAEGFARFGTIGAILERLETRQRILGDAWLTAIGHRRPGMNRGLPLKDAQADADRLDGELQSLLRGAQPR